MTEKKKDYQKILASIQKPVIGEAGKTGTWSNLKPELDEGKCIPIKSGKPACFNCWLMCPEACIEKIVTDESVSIKIDYDYCKGCGICDEECPVKAIKMIEVSPE